MSQLNGQTTNVLEIAAAVSDLQSGGVHGFAAVQHLTIDVPLATIQAQATTVAFNIGAALPSPCVIVAADINVIADINGVTGSCVAKVQNTGETAGALLGGSSGLNVFTGAPTGVQPAPGTNSNFTGRGGQQLQMTLVAGGGSFASATTGHLAVDIYYAVLP